MVTVTVVVTLVVVRVAVVTVAAAVTVGEAVVMMVNAYYICMCQAQFQAVDSFSLYKNLVRQVLFCPNVTGEGTEEQGSQNVELGFELHVCLAPNIQHALLLVTGVFHTVEVSSGLLGVNVSH